MTVPHPTTARRGWRPGAGLGWLLVVAATLAGSALGRVPALPSLADAGFVAGSVAGALLVRRGDVLRFALLPPLAYAVVGVLRAVVTVGTSATGALSATTGLIAGAPVMLGATAAALAVALVRLSRRAAPAPAVAARSSRLP